MKKNEDVIIFLITIIIVMAIIIILQHRSCSPNIPDKELEYQEYKDEHLEKPDYPNRF